MGSSISHRDADAKPAPPEVFLQRLARWWSRLDRPYRFNVGLYALATIALAALLFEVATGDDTSPRQQVASQGSTSTSGPTTTVRPTTTSSGAPSTSSSTSST